MTSLLLALALTGQCQVINGRQVCPAPIVRQTSAVSENYGPISARITTGGGAGSGVVVGPIGDESLVLTAGHVFRDPDTFKLYASTPIKVLIDGQTFRGRFLGCAARDDLAAVAIPRQAASSQLSRADSKKAWIVGFGGSGNLHQHELKFIEVRGREWVFQGNIGHGDSGAGVFNERGELTGIAVAYETYNRSRNIVVSSAAMGDFLRTDTCFRWLRRNPRQIININNQPAAPSGPEEPVPPPANPNPSPAPAPATAPVVTPASPGPVVIQQPPVDLSPILARLAAVEAQVRKPITFLDPKPDGTETAQQARLGDQIRLKIPQAKP